MLPHSIARPLSARVVSSAHFSVSKFARPTRQKPVQRLSVYSQGTNPACQKAPSGLESHIQDFSTVARDLESFRDELGELKIALQDEIEAPDPDLERRIADLCKTQATIQARPGLPAGKITSASSTKETTKQSNHRAFKKSKA